MTVRGTVPNVPHVSVANSDDKILTPFGPMLYQTYLSDEDTDLLLLEGRKLTKDHDDYNDMLAGNLRSGRSLHYGEKFTKSFEPIVMDKVFRFMDNAQKVFNIQLPEKESLGLETLWINYQKQYDFNPLHVHSHFLSFVVYCDIPSSIFRDQAECNMPLSGQIVFRYGETITPLSSQTYNVKPEKNLMFIFPSKLDHVVYPFFTDDTRISVAGNIVCDYSFF